MENLTIYGEIAEYLKENSQIVFRLDDDDEGSNEEIISRIYEATFEFIKEDLKEQLEDNDEAVFTIPERIEFRARRNDAGELEYKITALSEFKKRLKNDENM